MRHFMRWGSLLLALGCGAKRTQAPERTTSSALTPEECLDACHDSFVDALGDCGRLHGLCSSACNPSCAARCGGRRATCMGRCVSQCTQRCRVHHRECRQRAGDALGECRAGCAVVDAGPPDAPTPDAPIPDAGADAAPPDGPEPDAGTCGNRVCDAGETIANCYEDCACGDGTCQAPEKPYILFDFDTSGSMAWEVCDPSTVGEVDDALECPSLDVPCSQCNGEGCGNGVPDDGRLWKVKTATTQVVNTHPNATYALARFHGTPSAFACKGGGWVGAPSNCIGAPLGQGNNAADILVEFAAGNETNLLEWMDFQDNFAGEAPSTGCSLCPDCAGGCDKELRPTGATPLAGALFSANEYLDAVRANDPLGGCRPQAVILLTDGANNCQDPANQSDPDPTPEQAAALCADGVPVYVIGFAAAGIADQVGEIADAGCGPSCDQTGCDGQPLMADSVDDLVAALGEIIDAQNINACGESPASCAADCCNADSVCDPGENACCGAFCPDSCGDGCCTGNENLMTCVPDCG